MAKRKVTYPVAKTANRPVRTVGTGPERERPTVATIDLNAGIGRPGLKIGSRVRITGNGLYGGEIAVIERFATGVIPAAHVRTEGGKTRQVRTIDLEPVGPATPAATPAPAPAQAESAAQARSAAPTAPGPADKPDRAGSLTPRANERLTAHPAAPRGRLTHPASERAPDGPPGRAPWPADSPRERTSA